MQRYGAVNAQASADALLERLHGEKEFNDTFAAWLGTLPPQGSIFMPQELSDDELEMLQGGPLVPSSQSGQKRITHMQPVELTRANQEAWAYEEGMVSRVN